MKPLRFWFLFVACFCSLTAHGATTEPVINPEDLPRVKPTPAHEAHKTFQVRPGFHVELVAAEPDVIDPIALCFDEDGRMFVVEMRDYSERRDEKLGRIRMLQDTDGDGRYDKSTVFLQNLPWPTAVIYVNGGVLVGATPDIIFAKDTDGDGVADEHKVLFTGFGATPQKLNVQGLFNNFQWGLDNRIHGCSGLNGGLVKHVPAGGSPAAPPRVERTHTSDEAIDIRGKGFVIDPRDWSMTTENGGGQYGLSYDHTGRLFTCSNSIHIETFMYDARYAGRNPYATLPDPRICPAVDGPAAEVYRISPEEPWRVIRTRWRVAGIVGGPIEGGGRSAGYFTGATGITIYRGDKFGEAFVGNAFTGDAGGNLVHRKTVKRRPDSVELIAERAQDEKTSEFLASTDNWFRPVDFANTPDGTIYVCDMYRETIEHPWSIPPQIKQYLDLNSGNDRGRIWRVAPDGLKPARPPHFSEAGISHLVATLEHPNGWHRDTASRLLFQRQDKSAIPLLIELLSKSKSPIARMHAMHALDGLGGLGEQQVLARLEDDDALVRERAIRLSETLEPSSSLINALLKRADDESPAVRYQLTFTLGGVKHPEKGKALARIARRDAASRWARAAVINSLADGAGDVFSNLAGDDAFAATPSGRLFLESLAEMIGAKQDEGEVRAVVKAIAACATPALRFGLARGLADGSTRAGARDRAANLLGDVIAQAKTLARDPKAPLAERRQAVALLSLGSADDLLGQLLDDRSQTIQLAALAALDQADSPGIATQVISRWTKFSPRVQSESATLLLKRPARAKVLVEAIAARQIPANALDATQVAFLHKHADAALRTLAQRVLKPPARRDEVVERFRPALSLAGDAIRGKAIYQKLCISCHRAEGEGHSLGPDFVTVRNAGGEKLLLNILDPSREVANNYIAFVVETRDGQSAVGIITSDTPAAVTVREAYGRETVIPRDKIKRMTSQGKSLMPDGLEEGLQPQDVADLIRFIEAAQ